MRAQENRGSSHLRAGKESFGSNPLRKLGAAAAAASLLSATSAGIAVPTVAAAVQQVSKALSVLSERSPGVREAGAHSIKGKRKYSKVAKKAPRDALTPDSLAKNGVAYPKVFDLSADQAPIPASLALPADVPLAELMSLPSGFDMLSPVADVVPVSGMGGGGGNSIVPSGGGSGGGAIPPLGASTPTPTPTPEPTPTPTPTPPPPPPPDPTPTPTPPGVPEPSQWLMLVTAFTLMGGAMRWRNRSKAAV
jgi:hypothetical protein